MLNSPEIQILKENGNNRKKRRETAPRIEIEEKEGKERENKDNSFSEANLAQIIEGAQMDLNSIKNNPLFKNLNSQQKIVVLFHIFSKNLNSLLKLYVELMDKNLHQAKKYEEEIRMIRKKQQFLFNKIFSEIEKENGNGEYDQEIEEF